MAKEATYTVLAPRGLSGEAAEDGTLFLREGFSLFAFLFPFLYMLWHRHWLSALVLLLADGVLAGALSALPVNEGMVSAISLVLHLLFGAEAVNLRRALLTRSRYDERVVVRARSLEEAEIRYFASGDGLVTPSPALPASGSAVFNRAAGPHVLGLFPDADARPKGLG